MAWVTDSPNWVNNRTTSLKYRFLSSMQGGLGIGANLNKWADTDFADATRLIAAYKRVRRTVQQGDLYRLVSPQDDSQQSATLYVSPDKAQAVLFAFLHSSTKLNALPSIQLTGLDPVKRYRMRPIDADPSAAGFIQSGAYWMGHGVDLPLVGDFQAEGMILEAVDHKEKTAGSK
jgi:alpha-galactosidase